MGLGDAAISDAAIDRHVILSGTAMLENMLENAILKHFRSDMEEKERKRIFVGNEDNFGVLSTFNSRIVLARAMGVISDQVADDLHTIQAIRNHFAHAPLAFRFDEKEISDLINLLHKNPDIDSGIDVRGLFVRQSLLIYVITHYYFLLQIYWPGNMVTHASSPRI